MAERQDHPGGGVPPYGTTIQEAIAKGDLRHMRDVARQAEAWLGQHGDIGASLELLKSEIARRESRK